MATFSLCSNVATGLLTGSVILSSPEVYVCCGDELEINCTVPGRVLEWNITLMSPENTTLESIVDSVTLSFQPHTQTVGNGSISFIVSRISPRGNTHPLMSRLLISPATSVVNGTIVVCADRETRANSSTRLHIINLDTQLAKINISSRLEQYNSNDVTVLIDYSLTPQDLTVYSSLYSYQVVPVPVEVEIVGQRSAWMQVLYNTFYNVSVTGPCAMNSIVLFYANCGNLAAKVKNQSTLTIEYDYPALDVEGASVTFACPPGLMLSGPNTSTCMGNGEWEPDPRDVVCKMLDSTVTEENDNNILIVALVSATLATFLLTFVFTFILGCTCGICCCRNKCNKILSDSRAVYEDVIPTGGRQQESNLTLQQNVAYVSVVTNP